MALPATHRARYGRRAVVVASTGTVPLVGLAINAVLAVGSYGIARHGLGQPRGLDRVLATGVVFWTACTIGLEVLGAFGSIGLYPMAGWAAMILGVGALMRWFARVDNPDR